jgi:hypothetical protein
MKLTLHIEYTLKRPHVNRPFKKYYTKQHILSWKLFLNVTLHIQYTYKRSIVIRSTYQTLNKTPHLTLKYISELHTSYSVHIHTFNYQSVHLPNTAQNIISYRERYFWISNSIFSIHTNVKMSIGPFTKYHTKHHILTYKLFLNVSLRTQYTY